jgi:hypothetical protein
VGNGVRVRVGVAEGLIRVAVGATVVEVGKADPDPV